MPSVSTSFYIAKRYFFAKRQGAVQWVSAISSLGVMVATVALVVTLSVFNGFQDLVGSLFTAFDPQLKVTLAQGTTFSLRDAVVRDITADEAVAICTPTLEGQALVVRGGQQVVVTVKGVEEEWWALADAPSTLYPEPPEGTPPPALSADVLDYGLFGLTLATRLGLTVDFADPLPLYAPRRGERVNMSNPLNSFTTAELLSPGCVFAVKQAKYDANYVLTSLAFAERLLDKEGEATALELRLREGADMGKAKARLANVAGNRFRVQDRWEQQDDVFRIMRVEKFVAWLFLTFILLVASFTLVGSLSMLIIEKRGDIETLRALGMSRGAVRRVFVVEGCLTSFAGAVLGIVVGLGLCWAQQRWGFVAMGESEGAFIVEAYPVSVRLADIVLTLATVVAVSWFTACVAVRRAL